MGTQSRTRLAALVFLAASAWLMPGHVSTQGLDICGCGSIPDLPAFDSRNPATHPPGTEFNPANGWLTLKVPDDGIFRFRSFFAHTHIAFARNAANTPVTILVSGDVTFDSDFGCCLNVSVSGLGGGTGSGNIAGVGGLGGPGGARGGDGAHRALYAFAIGGSGFGHGGGRGGDPATGCLAGGGQFTGAPELNPFIGGPGGGGGCSSTPTCGGAGGGGGGGGGLLIAANGTFTVDDVQFFADGAGGGSDSGSTCASTGAGGSGGALRVLANRFVTVRRAEMYARGADGGGAGRIRLESLDASAQTAFATDPPAHRNVGPTPILNGVPGTVTITAVGGAAVLNEPPVGALGGIDITLNAPGQTTVDVTTSGVPGGTSVEVTVKPRMGGHPLSNNAALGGCNGAGQCQAQTSFNLAAGTYVVEARATFQTQ